MKDAVLFIVFFSLLNWNEILEKYLVILVCQTNMKFFRKIKSVQRKISWNLNVLTFSSICKWYFVTSKQHKKQVSS